MTEQAYQESVGKVDTNAAEIRLERAQNQYQFEQSGLTALKGESVVERYFRVREAIFGSLGNVQGAPAHELIRKDLEDFPVSKTIAEHYLPTFYTMVDTWQATLAEAEHDVTEQGLRLAAALYLMGVYIHNAIDGNHQTSRLLALSYIKEFCPQYQDSFFPIKYEADDHVQIRQPTAALQNIEDDFPVAETESDAVSLKVLRALKRLDVLATHAAAKEDVDFDLRIPAEQRLLKAKKTTDLLLKALTALFNAQQANGQETPEFFYEMHDRLLQFQAGTPSASILEYMQDDLIQYLETELVPKYPYSTFSVDNLNQQQQISALMNTLLIRPEGRAVLTRYVLNDPQGLQDLLAEVKSDRQLSTTLRNTLNVLQDLKSDMKAVLEPAATHQQKHEQQVQVA